MGYQSGDEDRVGREAGVGRTRSRRTTVWSHHCAAVNLSKINDFPPFERTALGAFAACSRGQPKGRCVQRRSTGQRTPSGPRLSTCRLLAEHVDIRTIQLMLGHADIRQTQRYLNLTDEELRKAMTGVWDRTEPDRAGIRRR